MHKYSIFSAPLFALFSAEFYRDVGRNWRGKAFVYLLLLEVVCWIPGIIVIAGSLREFIGGDGDKVARQIPSLSIKNGVAVVDAEQPYFIRAGDPERVVAILDTTGKYRSLEGTEAEILLTKNELIVKKSDHRTERHDLSAVDGVKFDGASARKWLGLFSTWAPVVLYPVLVLGAFVGRILLGLLYSLAGLIVANVTGVRLSYGGVLAISLLALTGPILLGTILDLAKVSVPYAGWIGFGIAMAYIVLGVTANKDVAGPPPLPAWDSPARWPQ